MISNLSFWEQDTFFDRVDVAIIGSGIVGLNAALSLKSRHKSLKIVVIERGMLPMGASSKNAGFACFGSPGELLDDLAGQDEDTVFSLVERRWKGLQRLRKNLGDKNIDYLNHGGFEVFDDMAKFEFCRERLDYLNKNIGPVIGLPEVYSDASGSVKQFGFKGITGMLLNKAEGQIDTGKMMSALISKVQQADVHIFNGFDVKGLTDEENHVEIVSSNGIRFQSRHVLICTNGFAKQLLPGYPVYPARAQVLVTKPIDNLKLKGTFHFDSGYYYFRDIGSRILLGGGRNIDFKTEETDKEGLTDIVQERLDDLLHRVIAPYAKPEVECRWSGIMGLGPDKTPIIKEVSKNVSCAVRLGGMGVAIGSLVGEEAAELVISKL
jgi:gamma-glutamylputrescine oxidase